MCTRGFLRKQQQQQQNPKELLTGNLRIRHSDVFEMLFHKKYFEIFVFLV